MRGPLHGLRVLDLSRVLSGPYATMQLADLGADVVKVEPPGGDETRRFGPPFLGEGEAAASVYFLSVNRGKRSIVLDLKADEDRALCARLIDAADVVVSNFRPGLLARRGLSPEQAVARRPALVWCRITGFGPDDPRPGYDNVVQAMSGIPAMTGPPDDPTAWKCGVSIADLVAGKNAAQAVLAALVQRGRTGRGGLVDVAMMDGLVDLLGYHAAGWLNGGPEPGRYGNTHPNVHPLRSYDTADGAVAVAVGNDGLFACLCEALELPSLTDEPRFRGNPSRVLHRDALDAVLAPRFAALTTDAALERLSRAGVPAGPTRSVAQALAADAQVQEHPHPHGGPPVQTVAPPWLVDGLRPRAVRGAPALDAHRDEVLLEWLPSGP
ncbi:MAG: CoA transferase [Alphaproteobacteria bacterium]|nr:CoA transferase [Alphaproteobacteria bacterium]